MSSTFKILIFITFISLLFSGCTDSKKKYWDNGNIQSELNYIDEKLDGIATWYYENGNKEQEVHYSQNVLNGSLIRWYQNGSYESKSNYVDGLMQGKAIMYDQPNVSNALAAKYIMLFSALSAA